MSKWETIQAIRQVNRTVAPEFLDHFEEQELNSYLRRLQTIQGRRGRQSVWVREGDTHAVVTCEG